MTDSQDDKAFSLPPNLNKKSIKALCQEHFDDETKFHLILAEAVDALSSKEDKMKVLVLLKEILTVDILKEKNISGTLRNYFLALPDDNEKIAVLAKFFRSLISECRLNYLNIENIKESTFIQGLNLTDLSRLLQRMTSSDLATLPDYLYDALINNELPLGHYLNDKMNREFFHHSQGVMELIKQGVLKYSEVLEVSQTEFGEVLNQLGCACLMKNPFELKKLIEKMKMLGNSGSTENLMTPEYQQMRDTFNAWPIKYKLMVSYLLVTDLISKEQYGELGTDFDQTKLFDLFAKALEIKSPNQEEMESVSGEASVLKKPAEKVFESVPKKKQLEHLHDRNKGTPGRRRPTSKIQKFREEQQKKILQPSLEQIQAFFENSYEQDVPAEKQHKVEEIKPAPVLPSYAPSLESPLLTAILEKLKAAQPEFLGPFIKKLNKPFMDEFNRLYARLNSTEKENILEPLILVISSTDEDFLLNQYQCMKKEDALLPLIPYILQSMLNVIYQVNAPGQQQADWNASGLYHLLVAGKLKLSELKNLSEDILPILNDGQKADFLIASDIDVFALIESMKNYPSDWSIDKKFMIAGFCQKIEVNLFHKHGYYTPEVIEKLLEIQSVDWEWLKSLFESADIFTVAAIAATAGEFLTNCFITSLCAVLKKPDGLKVNIDLLFIKTFLDTLDKQSEAYTSWVKAAHPDLFQHLVNLARRMDANQPKADFLYWIQSRDDREPLIAIRLRNAINDAQTAYSTAHQVNEVSSCQSSCQAGSFFGKKESHNTAWGQSNLSAFSKKVQQAIGPMSLLNCVKGHLKKSFMNGNWNKTSFKPMLIKTLIEQLGLQNEKDSFAGIDFSEKNAAAAEIAAMTLFNQLYERISQVVEYGSYPSAEHKKSTHMEMPWVL